MKGGDGGDLFDYAGFVGEGQDDGALGVREGAGLYGFLVIHGGGDVIEGYAAVLGVVGGGGGFEDGFHGGGGNCLKRGGGWLKRGWGGVGSGNDIS